TLSKRDLNHVFERLRSGVVPERGLDTFAVGVERQRNEISRLLELAAEGEGVFKFLRGGYGCGKTFMARLAMLDAQQRGFATSFVVVSDNDLHFHKFDELYRKVVQGLATISCPGGALGDIIDRWIGAVEDALIAGGADEEAADFDDLVTQRLAEEINSMTGGRAPEDLVRVLRAVFSLKQQGDVAGAGSLISWLAGSGNVAASAKRTAGIKGDISGGDAMNYLHGIVEIVKAAGYQGLVIVIDEAETILRMRRDVRNKSLNGIRQICDDAATYHGLLWVFTGTEEFFDLRQGVAGLQPLHDRIRFIVHGQRASLRQSQLQLQPFDQRRLREVAIKLRELYPSPDRARLDAKVSNAYLAQLVEQSSQGFGGDVGVVPRQFLRQLVEVLDLVCEDESFDPIRDGGFVAKDQTAAELCLAAGEPPYVAADDSDGNHGNDQGQASQPVVVEF
ncbi:MAG: BREX system ATP-binding protein BrxD, partial [Delftia sp.]|nr:BREX system ATP-binding protein BrxD [Delftia sp.]